ncbi:MAG: molybdopterin cofactor-binding domain-containing protein [Burkholderiales bacterium]|jgi:isoquinoline 1-oxidoreductase beta subunit
MKRRSFLVAATVAGGAFLVGCAPAARQRLRDGTLRLANGEIALNGWVKVAPDGTVTALMGRSEMGQGVHTALMMLVCEELDCAWSQMRAAQAPVDRLYGNVVGLADGTPFRAHDEGTLARAYRWGLTAMMREVGFNMTGGSASVRDLWIPMREAAAVTRATLVAAVAKAWSVPVADVKLAEGSFTGPGGKTMGFGDAVKALGPNPEPAAGATLKDPSTFRLIGRSMKRDDALAKTTGTATFGIDVRRPDMLFAAVRMSPVPGGKVKTFDGAKAKALPGVAGVVPFEPPKGASGGVAVVADRWWRAKAALDAVEASFDDGPLAGASSEALIAGLSRTLDTDTGFALWKDGDADAAIAGAAKRVEAEYRAPWLAHATMEPMNCTVEYRGDSATVWAPTQVPGFARHAAAEALGLADEAVELVVTYLGGGFGRRLETDFVVVAAQVAKAFKGRAVQVLWSREEDMRHDFYRPACVARYAAGLDASGKIAGWRAVSAGQGPTAAYLPRNTFIPNAGLDKTALEGAYDAAYRFPAVRVAHVAVDLPVPVGYWRSVGHSHQAFFKESFLDECAHAAGADPLAYRLALLEGRPRQRAVLELAASKAGWGTPVPAAPDGAKAARGLALHESFGATVAQVAEVSVAADGTIRVHRVTCAIDCGVPVNPDGIAQQLEGSVVFGLSAALNGRVDIEQGRPKPGNFHEYAPLRLPECPEIAVHVVPSTAPPEGVGEPAVPPVAPAVANAVFALTGKRLRALPLSLAA